VIKIHRNFSFDGEHIQLVELFVRHRILKKMAWMKMLNFLFEKMKKEKKLSPSYNTVYLMNQGDFTH